jgi:hypothetical protein
MRGEWLEWPLAVWRGMMVLVAMQDLLTVFKPREENRNRIASNRIESRESSRRRTDLFVALPNVRRDSFGHRGAPINRQSPPQFSIVLSRTSI